MANDRPPASGDLGLLTTIVIAEQNNYWLRFTAFSALTAALIVVVFSSDNAAALTFFGVFLSLIWTFVQWASYNYVLHYDEVWEPKIEALGFRTKDKKFWGGFARTTFLGAITATSTLIFWLVVLLWPDFLVATQS